MITIYIKPDEIAHRLEIPVIGIEGILLRSLQNVGIARSDRVDEHQVGHVQNGIFVVNHLHRKLCRQADGVKLQAAWAEKAKLQPEAGTAGAAVEGEGDGPLCHVVHVTAGIGGKEDFILTETGRERHCSRRGRIRDSLSLNDRLMFGDDQIVLQNLSRRRGRFGLLLCIGWQKRCCQNQDKDQKHGKGFSHF